MSHYAVKGHYVNYQKNRNYEFRKVTKRPKKTDFKDPKKYKLLKKLRKKTELKTPILRFKGTREERNNHMDYILNKYSTL